MFSWRIVAAWLAAVILTTLLTWQIVGLADSQVGETPIAVAPASTSPSTDPGSTSSSSVATTTSSPPRTTTTSVRDTTSTSQDQSSTAPTSPSSDSTAPTGRTETEWSVRTINSSGGSVVIRYRPEEVELQAATPAPGFAVEIDDDGPDRVRVEFEGDEAKSRVEARWQGGELDVRVDEGD